MRWAGETNPTSVASMLVAALLVVVLLGACGRSAPSGGVHVLTAEGVVNPVMANYLDRGIADSERAEAAAVVIRLDTPGGLDTSMRQIVQRINASAVPVVVYVSPSGARAGSAGTFITLAGHVAAMAPNTAIGAAHPVSAGGQDIEGDLRTKAENDAAAYLRSIAQDRGRNEEWAERAVRESVSASASEAVELDVVDLEADTLDELLEAIDGREVALGGDVTMLATADAPRYENGMTLSERFLSIISDPNIAFLLLSLGSLALVLELFNPSGVGAVVGLLALIVAFFSLGTLPVNWAGAALVLVGVGLLTAEIFVASGGLLGIGGAVVMMFGALFLTTSSQPQFEVSRWVAVGVPVAAGAGMGALAIVMVRTRRRTAQIGPQALIGLTGVVHSGTGSEVRYVLVRGERWRAHLDPTSRMASVDPGDAVVVTGVTGIDLTVRPVADSGPASAEAGTGGEASIGGAEPAEQDPPRQDRVE